MLTEAQIEIVDEAGHVEDRVRIVGTGEVALATKDRAWLQLPSEDPTDVDAIIALRDGFVVVEAKKPRALRVDEDFLPIAQPRGVPDGLVALIAAVNRHLHVRTVEVPSASAMGPGGIVIREETSDFERWLDESAARGAAEVSEQLADLRARGMIDEHGKLLVPFPEDMNPDSKTDV